MIVCTLAMTDACSCGVRLRVTSAKTMNRRGDAGVSTDPAEEDADGAIAALLPVDVVGCLPPQAMTTATTTRLSADRRITMTFSPGLVLQFR